MLSRLGLVFIFVVQTNSLSNLTDDKTQTTTTFIRYLLNQETLIRMALDRKVNDLVNSMTAMENKMVTTKMEIAALRHENSALKAELQVQSNVTTHLSGMYNHCS